jgi:histidine triad (HIT) family protein
MPTVFELIVEKKIPAHIVYEDDSVIAILDINPVAKGHVLVFPKVCYQDIQVLPDEIARHVFFVVTKISKSIFDCYNPRGINVISNNKEGAGQTVPHFHIHIIPRYSNDDFKIIAPNIKLHDSDFDEIKLTIKESLTKN